MILKLWTIFVFIFAVTASGIALYVLLEYRHYLFAAVLFLMSYILVESVRGDAWK